MDSPLKIDFRNLERSDGAGVDRQRVPAQPALLTRSTPAQFVRQHLMTNLFRKLNVGSHAWASL
jgi:hypothetical protein